MDSIIRYIFHCIYLILMAGMTYTYWYNHLLLLHLGFGVILLIGFYVAFSIFLGIELSKSKNLKIKAIGDFYGIIFMYTSLFQGTVLINLTFYIISSIHDLSIYELHMVDWIYGMTYSGFITYGLGCLLSFTVAENFIGKVLSALIVLIHWISFLYLFLYENEFRILFHNMTNLIIGLSFVIQMLSSVLMIKIMLGSSLKVNNLEKK